MRYGGSTHREYHLERASSQERQLPSPDWISQEYGYNDGRINFAKEIPEGNIVFFQGSGGLQSAVEKGARVAPMSHGGGAVVRQ